jgi:hypothetical protein
MMVARRGFEPRSQGPEPRMIDQCDIQMIEHPDNLHYRASLLHFQGNLFSLFVFHHFRRIY